jgi:hypothetical protein
MVTPVGGWVATLDVANAVHDDAVGFARRCLQAVAPGADLTSPGAGLTTGQRDLRNDVVPAFAQQLTESCQGRLGWLVLEGFDAAGSEIPASVRDFLLVLVRNLGSIGTLRLVFVGWPEAPPAGFEDSVEELIGPTGEDIARLIVPIGKAPDPRLVEGAAAFLAVMRKSGIPPYEAARDWLAQIASSAEAKTTQEGHGE